MKIIKKYPHEPESVTQTLPIDIREQLKQNQTGEQTSDQPSPFLNQTEGKKKTRVYEPRPLNPQDPVYDRLMEQIGSRPVKPKYWFEEFGDYWSCSCGHINKGDVCVGCGLERQLLRNLFILHRPTTSQSMLGTQISENRKRIDQESAYNQAFNERYRTSTATDLHNIQPIDQPETAKSAPAETSAPLHQNPQKEGSTLYTNTVAEAEATDAGQVQGDTNTASPSQKINVKDVVSTEQLPAIRQETAVNDTIVLPPKKGHTKRNILIAVIIALVLTLAGAGYYIYTYIATPAMEYEDALKLMDNGKYEEAIEKFKDLGDYEDCEEMIRKCYISMGDDYLADKSYKEAMTAYETAQDMNDDSDIKDKIRSCYIAMGDDYLDDDSYSKAMAAYEMAQDMNDDSDIKDKINEVKFAYVKSHQSKGGDTFESYLDELKELNYPGIDEIYDKYYAWHMKVIANSSEDDYSTNKKTYSREETVYFHSILSGGEPDETIRLYYKVSWPDGHEETQQLGSEWKSGSRITARFSYPIALLGTEGKLTYHIYDAQSNEEMGSCTVTFKN